MGAERPPGRENSGSRRGTSVFVACPKVDLQTVVEFRK